MIIWPLLSVIFFTFGMANYVIARLKKYIENCVDDAKKEIMNQMKNG